MSEFSMDAVVTILTDRGVPNAYVEQTGGGIASIYAGPTFEEEGYGTRYAACAGPGRYGWTPGSESMGDTDEFYVGPDDYGDDLDAIVTAEAGWTVEQIADAVEARVVKFCAERMVERIRDDQAAGAIPKEWDGFAALHDHCDANEYVLEVLPPPEQTTQPFLDLCGKVIDAVNERMEADDFNPRAAALALGADTCLGQFEDHKDTCEFVNGPSATCTC